MLLFCLRFRPFHSFNEFNPKKSHVLHMQARTVVASVISVILKTKGKQRNNILLIDVKRVSQRVLLISMKPCKRIASI